MGALPSKVIVGTAGSAPPMPGFFFAFGERDDPLRLAVLLAEHVARRAPDDGALQQQASVCRDPKASWKARQAALGEALALAAERERAPFLAFVDLDALAPVQTEGWKGDRSVTMKRDLYRVVLDAIGRSGWLVVRTCPTETVSTDLADLDVEVSYAAAIDTPVEEAEPFAPEIRPIALWLVHRGALGPRDLSRIVADVEHFDAHVVDLAYDALSGTARDAGKLVAGLRPPQRLNGVLGPFELAQDSDVSSKSLPRRAVDELRASGFLQPGPSPSTLRMPRLVRDQLRAFAPLGMAKEVRRLHAQMAAQTLQDRATSDQLEIHHHAVLARDVERAKGTARFYGTELRDLATQLSLEANRRGDRAGFRRAADLFEYVVLRFDPSDAYAWEYYGYNLARTSRTLDATTRARVREAYDRAHRLWPGNPLYHGRLLGFRGEHGENVTADVSSWLDRYVQQFGDERDAVSFFAEAALNGLRRGHQDQQVAQIVARKRPLLERFAPRALAAIDADE